MNAVVAAACFVGYVAFSAKVKHGLLHALPSSLPDSLHWNQPIPDFTLRDRSGAEVTLSKVIADNKLVMINFWGTWCGPCRMEMPTLERVFKDTANKGFTILAIDVGDRPGALNGYLAGHPLSFPILVDASESVVKRYGIHAFPTSIFVGHDGKMVNLVEGTQSYMPTTVSMYLKDIERKEKEKKAQ